MRASVPPRLYAIADVAYMGGIEPWLDLLRQLNEAAARHRFIVQVRAPGLDGAEFATAARKARRIMDAAALLVLNGPGDLADDLGYEGVHWPESRIPPAAPEGAPAFRSAAVHSMAAVRKAETAGATALIYSPIFPPSWKAADGVGFGALRDAAEATDLPVYALGGVSVERTSGCMDAGAHGVAAVSGIATENPGAAVAAYLRCLRVTG